MDSKSDWIASRVAEAQRNHPAVTKAAASRLEKLLRGEFVEGKLSSGDRTKIADLLIADMLPDPSKEV